MMDVDGAAQYLPDLVLDLIFSKLKPSDLFSCMLVCRRWCQTINDRRATPWKLFCRRRMCEEILKSNLLSQFNDHKSKVRALYHSWNPRDCSVNLVVKHNGFTFERKPVRRSTDMIRTKIGYNTGKHGWEITWNGPLGTVAMVGVSTEMAPLYCEGYKPLLGANEHSWGWNLVDNFLLHNAISRGKYPLLKKTKYKIHEKLRLVLDSDNGTLHFEKNNVNLGIAFNNLPKTKLYPSVSVVYGETELSIVYIGNL